MTDLFTLSCTHFCVGTQPPPMPQSVNDSTVSQSSTVGSDFEDTGRVHSPGEIELHEKSPSDMTDSKSEVTRRPDYNRQIENQERMPSPSKISLPESQRHYNTDRESLQNGPISSTPEGYVPMSNDLVSREIEPVIRRRSSSPDRHVSPLESTRQVPNYKTDTGDTYASVLPRQDRHNKEGLTLSRQTMATTTYTNGATVELSPTESLTETTQTVDTQATGHIKSYTPMSEELVTSKGGPRQPLPYKDHVVVRDNVGSSQSGRKLPQPIMSRSPISSPPPDPGYVTVGSSVGGVKIGSGDHRNSGYSSPEMDLKLPGQVKFLTIHKRKGLGISVIGGIDHPDEGPHVYIENIVEESDAFRVRYVYCHCFLALFFSICPKSFLVYES